MKSCSECRWRMVQDTDKFRRRIRVRNTMKKRHAYKIALCIVFCAVSVVISITSVGSASAATSRSWVWRRWDVQITNIDTQANSFHVSETHTINVTQGSFAGGGCHVSSDRVASISSVWVM